MIGIITMICCFNFTYIQNGDSCILPKNFPLKEGYIASYSNFIPDNPSMGVTIFSSNVVEDSVFCLFEGSVYLVQEEDNKFLCTIKSSSNTITYANISDCNVKKDSIVKKGNYLGRLCDTEGSRKFLTVTIANKERILTAEEHLKILCR